MGFPAQVYNGGVESGGGCPCVTPPTSINTAAQTTVRVNGLTPVLQGHSMSPAAGKTCSSDPSPCTSPRTVIASGMKVRINGLAVAKIGDKLNVATGISLTGATVSANVNFT